MSVPGRRAFYMLILLIVMGSLTPIWAAGTREDPVSEAEALVEELRYNEAILLLTDFMRKHPDRFDEAQVLLNKIREAREYYNEKYSDLIEAYQGNLEEAYPIIRELEELDPDPNEAAAQSLKLAKETAGFVYNNNRFLSIMDQAREMLDNGLYYEAIGVYSSGFDLSREIFEDEGYGNIIESIVERLAESLQRTVSDCILIGSTLDENRERLQIALEEKSDLEESLSDFLEPAEDINEKRETLNQLSKEFIETEADIRMQRSDEKQVYYLVFLNRLLEGRTESEDSEGIIYAIEQAWIDRMQKTEEAFWNTLTEIYGLAEQAFIAGDDTELVSSTNDLADYAEQFSVFVTSWNNGLYMNRQFEPSSFVGDIVTEKLPLYTGSLLLRDVASSFQILAETRESMGTLEFGLAGLETFEEVEALIGNLVSIEETLAEQRNFWEAAEVRIDDYSEGPGDFSYLAEIAEDMREHVDIRLENASTLRVSSVNRKTVILLEPVGETYEEIFVSVNEGEKYLEGLVEMKGEGEQAAEVVYHYPDRALELFSEATGMIEELEEKLTEVTAFLNGEDPSITETEKIQERIAEKDALSEQVERQKERIKVLAAEAEEKSFLAARYRQEGDRRLQEAQQLTDRNQFAAAKERLVAAADRFDESLFYQEDPDLRQIRDERITALYEEINDAENALVIREVRDYIIGGKAFYSQGEFAQAQNILLKAENRWRDTNIESNPEIDYWLSLTQTALSVTSGRQVEETDPLYAEMSQYLNQARADYRTGRKLADEEEKEEADFYLNRAEKNILYVQQYFPFNKEARVLNLLISQIRDEKQFLDIFKKDFSEAKQLISTNPQKAYIDLKDLEAISPDYPGMAQAILEAEYAAGLKVRPPDRTKINQAAKLYDDAFRIYTAGNRAQYPLALSLLDEAIRLNPDNISAIRLKDNISVETGGQSTSVLSNEDQQVYLEAVNAFTGGNYLKASILVDILLKNPDNQRNTKLLELQERIETVR